MTSVVARIDPLLYKAFKKSHNITMSSQIDLVAVISPKPGKTDRVSSIVARRIGPLLTLLQVVELLQGVAEYVKKNEPGTNKYQITRSFNKQAGVEEVIMLERFARSGFKWVLDD